MRSRRAAKVGARPLIAIVRPLLALVTNRGVLWHLKWLFASFAVGFAALLLFSVVSLPFVGFRTFRAWTNEIGGVRLGGVGILLGAMIAAPFVYRRLR